MNVDEFRRAGHEAIEQVARYYEKLAESGASQATGGFPVTPSIKPGDIYRQIASEPPEEGESFDEIQKDFEKLILPGTCHWQHPSFFAYFPANSSFESIIADIYATATSTPGFNHSCNPVATEVEQATTSWAGQMLGLDPSFSTNGVIQGTASESALVAAIAARERAIRILLEGKDSPYRTREEIFSRLVIYGSTQTHSLGAKAGFVLGIPFRALETKKEDNWALTGETVRRELEADRAKGKIPFMLVATVGTTSSGAVDKIDELCTYAQDYPEIWIHVDSAWAGVYLALPEHRQALQLHAINARGPKHGQEDTTGEVHSFCTNLHKSGLVALECSLLFVRDSKLLTEVLDVTPPFLRNHGPSTGQVTDYRNWGLTLGRRFRSLKVLFMLKSNGVSGFQRHLRKSIALTERLEEEIRKDERFELVTPRSLALLVFRMHPTDVRGDEKKLDDLNRRLYANLHKTTAIQLTSTVIGGVFCIRFAIGSIHTREQHIIEAWRIVQAAAEEELDV